MVFLAKPQPNKVSPSNMDTNDADDTMETLQKFVTQDEKSPENSQQQEGKQAAGDPTSKETNPIESTSTESSEEEATTSTTSTTLSKYEELIEAMPLKEADAKIVVAAGQLGLLHEALALRALNYCKSSPLVSYKDEKDNINCRKKYYHHAEINDAKSTTLANLSAFIYWDYAWNYHRRHETRRKFENLSLRHIDSSADCRVWQWSTDVVAAHAEWCKRRDINPMAVRAISKVIDNTIATLFQAQFEPEWLRCTDPTPVWRRFSSWRGELESYDHDMLYRVYGNSNAPLLCDTLRKLCHVGGDVNAILMPALELVATHHDWEPCQVGNKGNNAAVEKIQQFLAKNTFEADNNVAMGVRLISHYSDDQDLIDESQRYGTSSMAARGKNRLAKFKAWNTVRHARPSSSEFLQGTRAKGGNYVFMHDPDSVGVASPMTAEQARPCDGFYAIAPMISGQVLHGGAYSWFLRKAEHLLLMGEGDFSFSESLFTLGHPPLMSSTNERTAPPRPKSRKGLLKRVFAETGRRGEHRRVTSLDATRVHRYAKIQNRIERSDVRYFAWNFPKKEGGNDAANEDMIQSTFSSLATLYDLSMDYDLPILSMHPFLFGLTLHDDQFSRWFVLRSALRAGWRLRSWCPFDYTSFPGYRPCGCDGQPLTVKNARFYVFQYMYCNVL